MRHGFLLIDKPIGPTSHDVVAHMRRKLSERSIGHLGTLDPEASGLMVLGVGKKALKVIELFADLPKEYHATIKFGAVSTTYDAAGHIEEQAPKPGWSPPDLPTLRQIIEDRFVGKREQVPPAYSAVHIDGVRAYDLARQGKKVDIKPRMVEIARCEIISYEYPYVEVAVHCSSGTYIRSLAHDLGCVLRAGGYLTALRRTKVGKWDIAEAVQPDDVSWTDIQPLKNILAELPRIDLSESEWKEIGFGRSIHHYADTEVIAWYLDLPVALLKPSHPGEKRVLKPRKVF